MAVPFMDLSAQYKTIESEISQAIEEVLISHAFIKGPSVKKFENIFAEYLSAKYCVGVGNGTDAIFLALKALGAGPGDQVITVPNTFIATTEMITATGADIIWADISPDTYLMDQNSLESLITDRTKVILPVLLYGNVLDMKRLFEFTKSRGLYLLADAAQAHGAQWDKQNITEFCDVATYSFYPGKNLGAYGDAGAVVTNNEQIAESVRMNSDHGRKDKYIHQFEGYSSRLDSIQASVLSVKLQYLDEWNTKRRHIAEIYTKKLSNLSEITLPCYLPQAFHVYHLFVVRVSRQRDRLAAYLEGKDIKVGVHYPVPLPFQPAYEHKVTAKERTRFSYVKDISDEILSLPIFPEMTEGQIVEVCDALYSFFQENPEDNHV